jgi:hypothetical protein
VGRCKVQSVLATTLRHSYYVSAVIIPDMIFCNIRSWPVGQLNYYWPSPAQSFLVPSPTALMTIFYFLTTLGMRARITVTLRLEVYRQSLRLGDKTLETHD